MEQIAELYRLYYADIYRYAYSLLRHPQAAEDVAQATFVAAIEGIARFRGDSAVKTWLLGICRNQCRAYGRTHPPTAPLSGEALGAERDRDSLAAMDLVACLPEPQRSIVRLHLFADLPFRAIGRQLGMSEAACRVAFFRAKAKLMEVLRRDEA